MNSFKTLGLAAVLLLGTSEAQAMNPNPGIVPPDHSFHGMTYAQWSAELMQWGLGIPIGEDGGHPGPDTTGEFADMGQSGPVWFLALNLSGVETVTRTVTVPSDKFLFVPIINSIWVPRPGPAASADVTLARMRYNIETDVDTMISELTYWCEIDGVAVSDLQSYRAVTALGEAYYVDFPDNNIWGFPAGRYGPSLNGGIYLLLRPLSPGEHTIEIYVSDDAGSFTDLTYELTVE
jgi:hypothetical protein